jgi:hypothetical protein
MKRKTSNIHVKHTQSKVCIRRQITTNTIKVQAFMSIYALFKKLQENDVFLLNIKGHNLKLRVFVHGLLSQVTNNIKLRYKFKKLNIRGCRLRFLCNVRLYSP